MNLKVRNTNLIIFTSTLVSDAMIARHTITDPNQPFMYCYMYHMAILDLCMVKIKALFMDKSAENCYNITNIQYTSMKDYACKHTLNWRFLSLQYWIS